MTDLPTHHERYRNSETWLNKTLPELAHARAMQTPDAPVFVGGEPAMSFGSVFEDAEALASTFAELGLKPGDSICFQLPNWHETAVINLAAAIAGLIVVPIVPIYRDAEMSQMLADCDCRLIFIAEQFRNFDYAAMMERIGPSLPALDHVFFVRGSDPARDYQTLVENGRGRSFGAPLAQPNAVKLLLFTSGTTGRAKGVMHSQNTISAVLGMSIRHWGIGEGEVLLMPSPVTHLTGYGYLETPFIVGAPTLLMESWNAEEAVTLIDRHDVIGTVSATPFLKELIECAQRRGSSLPSLRFFACGGAAVPPAVIRNANKVCAQSPAFRIYGCTEAPLITMGFLGKENAELAATTDGKIEDYDVRILDDDENDVAPGEEGEIAARGPAMMLGYLDPAQTAESLTADGYYKTGDLGIVTPDNAIVVTGRKKDLIIRGGENISAKEIEDILYRHGDVVDAAIVSMPHPRLGEGICAFVVRREGSTLDTDALIAFVGEAGLAKQKWPEHVEWTDELPKTATGKVRKDLLRAEIKKLSAVQS